MKALATDLSNNILERGKIDGIKITPMKLQKILYYVCRDYVKATGQMPIGEQFEVWQYGPVLSSVYGEFKDFKDRPITSYAKNANGRSYKVSENDNPTLMRIIDIAWAKYKNLTGIQLSKMTHGSGSGWIRAYLRGGGGSLITVEDMKNDTTG